jgi:hypothetical protein
MVIGKKIDTVDDIKPGDFVHVKENLILTERNLRYTFLVLRKDTIVNTLNKNEATTIRGLFKHVYLDKWLYGILPMDSLVRAYKCELNKEENQEFILAGLTHPELPVRDLTRKVLENERKQP